MVDETDVKWPIEEIPDEDHVFIRAHRSYFKKGKLKPGVFRDHGKSMSVNWDSYSTPEETQQQARIPEHNGVVGLITGEVRKVPLEVEHSPELENRAHSEIIGNKDPEVRIKLKRICQLIFKPPVMDG
jgi:hypothetical protein